MRTLKILIPAVLILAAGLAAAPAQTPARTVPTGTQLEVLLQTLLTSRTAKLEDRFEATNLQNYEMQGQVALPAGAIVRGFVSSVKPSTKVDHQGQMTLSFDELRIGEQPIRLRASVVAVLDPKRPEPISRSGMSPAVVDRVDRISVPLAGVFVGVGGSLLSSNGSDVSLPIGAVLRIRLDRPLDIPAGR